MNHADLMNVFYEWAAHIVFWCSLATLFLAVIERWAKQWLPARASYVVSALADLVSQFGALNLRDRIAPKSWDGVNRRDNPTPPSTNSN